MADQSIHPRVVNGRTKFEKSNTAKPYKGGGGKLARKQERLNNRRNANAATIRSKEVKNPEAFKTPGSMKQGT